MQLLLSRWSKGALKLSRVGDCLVVFHSSWFQLYWFINAVILAAPDVIYYERLQETLL